MSAHVTKKRARADSAMEGGESDSKCGLQAAEGLHAGTQQATRTRDRDFWFDDGNVLLVAGSVEFRVYKGILEEDSSVFRHFFSSSRPSVASSSHAARAEIALPAAHLTDSPEDLRHVLRVCFPRSNMRSFLPEHPTFDCISAAIRLGHKYEMSALVQQALDYLKKHYTTDIDIWGAHTHYEPPGFREIHCIGVVNLARLTGELSLLPTALLVCCILDDELVRGFEREDGTLETLALDDLGRCFKGKTQLARESMRILLSIEHSALSGDCKRPGECRRGLLEMCVRFEKHVHDFKRVADPLQLFVGPEPSKKGDLCKPCHAKVEEHVVREERAVWAKLPELMGIDGLEIWGRAAAPGNAATDTA